MKQWEGKVTNEKCAVVNSSPGMTKALSLHSSWIHIFKQKKINNTFTKCPKKYTEKKLEASQKMSNRHKILISLSMLPHALFKSIMSFFFLQQHHNASYWVFQFTTPIWSFNSWYYLVNVHSIFWLLYSP